MGRGSSTPTLNGQPTPLTLASGYVALRRTWQSGDTIELTLPMPPRRVLANEQVEADCGRVALQRGPLIYCFEWPDQPDRKVLSHSLPTTRRSKWSTAPTCWAGSSPSRRAIWSPSPTTPGPTAAPARWRSGCDAGRAFPPPSPPGAKVRIHNSVAGRKLRFCTPNGRSKTRVETAQNGAKQRTTARHSAGSRDPAPDSASTDSVVKELVY